MTSCYNSILSSYIVWCEIMMGEILMSLSAIFVKNYGNFEQLDLLCSMYVIPK